MNLNYLSPYVREENLKQLQLIKRERESLLENSSFTKLSQSIDQLPQAKASLKIENNKLIMGQGELTQQELDQVQAVAKELIPWRKGPFDLFDFTIDAEWQCQMKWSRIQEYIPSLEGKSVLDVGCNNGFFMFQLMQKAPAMILGIDPIVHNLLQFKFLQKYAQAAPLHFELFGVEQLPLFPEAFDLILFMGIIYHHRNPIAQLIDLRESLRPGGCAILETIGIPGDEPYALFPPKSYAKMSNVWFIPTLSCFINWAQKAKFSEIEVISSTILTEEEQRLTPWCPPPKQSLSDFLDSSDKMKTVEGYPAPMRFCLKVKKKG